MRGNCSPPGVDPQTIFSPPHQVNQPCKQPIKAARASWNRQSRSPTARHSRNQISRNAATTRRTEKMSVLWTAATRRRFSKRHRDGALLKTSAPVWSAAAERSADAALDRPPKRTKLSDVPTTTRACKPTRVCTTATRQKGATDVRRCARIWIKKERIELRMHRKTCAKKQGIE